MDLLQNEDVCEAVLAPVEGTSPAQCSTSEVNENQSLSFKQMAQEDISGASPKGHRATIQMLHEEEIDLDDLEGLHDESNIIGKGSFGEVRKVLYRKTPVAAKMCHASLPEHNRQLVIRELQLMVRCRHPNIVQFLGYVDSPFTIVMEVVPMGDLRTYWRRHRMSTRHKTSICIDVMRAVAYLHNRKPGSIIHRDIKPTNVLITRSGVAKLTDFGLSRIFLEYVECLPSASAAGSATPAGRDELARPRRSRPSTDAPRNQREKPADLSKVVGTWPYAAPESARTNYDEKVDIYSSAVTFYELFEQASFDDALGFGFALTPSKIRPLLVRMGKRDPTERPSALEAIQALEATNLARDMSANSACSCSVS